jgi:hypothetical protein
MKPSELFGVVVRTIGLLIVLEAVSLICVATLHIVLRIVLSLFVGVYFLSGAESLVDLVYPSPPRDP